MWVWAWRGLSDSWRNRIVQPPWSGVLLSLLVISLSLNAYKSRNDRRFAETWLPVVEIQEVALWAKGNLHPESRIAIDFRLPAVHFRAALGRPIWVDVFHPTARTSPIAIVGAGQERPTHVVLASRGAEIYAPPTGWRMVFASHGPNGAMGVFQLYEVRE